MKKFIAFAFLLSASIAAISAQVNVRGYYRKDGTYVRPHVRTSPNHTTLDNYSAMVEQYGDDSNCLTPPSRSKAQNSLTKEATLIYA